MTKLISNQSNDYLSIVQELLAAVYRRENDDSEFKPETLHEVDALHYKAIRELRDAMYDLNQLLARNYYLEQDDYYREDVSEDFLSLFAEHYPFAHDFSEVAAATTEWCDHLLAAIISRWE